MREGCMVTKIIKDHNRWIKTVDKQHLINEEQLLYHQRQIMYLQEERLVHLIVTGIVSILLFGSFIGMLMLNEPSLFLLFCIFFVLEIFYIKHYYLLENNVQYWYEVDQRWSRTKHSKE